MQSNYCAGNAILDQLASFGPPALTPAAVPVLTLNWGPWGEVGMAAKGTKAYAMAVKVSAVCMCICVLSLFSLAFGLTYYKPSAHASLTRLCTYPSSVN